jgi:hypothetical protein
MEAHSEMPARQLIITFMEHKKQNSSSLLKAFACAIITVGIVAMAHAQDAKVDPTGTWTWANPGRNGNPGTTNTLVLKYSGGSLTGTLKAPGRGGNIASTEISDGKLTGAEITFGITRTMGTNTLTSTYTGTVTADSIKGTIAATSRTGEKRSRKWEAKRATSGT